MSQIEVRVPGRVYDDALDPSVTQIENELGLPQPDLFKRGRGHTWIYHLNAEQATDLASYLDDRSKKLILPGISMQVRELSTTMARVAYVTRHKVATLPE